MGTQKEENRLWRIFGRTLKTQGREKGGPKNGVKNGPSKNGPVASKNEK